MKMYQVKHHREHHIPVNCPHSNLVKDELLTQKEFTDWRIPREWVRLIDVKRDDVYILFGARFAESEDITVLQEVI